MKKKVKTISPVVTKEEKTALLNKAKEEGNKAVEEKKKKLEAMQREIELYALANDYQNIRASQAEAECYALTYNELKNKGEKTITCSDGVIRPSEYYAELYFQHKRASQYMQIQFNRALIQKSVTLKELQEFINKIEDNNGTKD